MGLGTLPEASVDTGEGLEESGAIFAEINITPLTDVVLVLMIILMIYAGNAVTQMQAREAAAARAQSAGMKVNLPEGSAREIETASTSLVISILADGNVFVNGQQVASEDLDQIFANQFQKDNETQVVIKADGDAAHRRVVGVMERAKNTGLRRIAIATAGN